MKSISILQSNLSLGLSTVSHAISTHSTIPILLNIHLSFSKKYLTLFSTDLEIGIETKVICEKSEPFTTTVPANVFIELVNTIPADQIINLDFDEALNNMQIKVGKSVHNIKCIPADDYPKPPANKAVETFTLDLQTFKDTVSRVLFAASDEDAKPVLASAIFCVEPDKIVIYATDGFRASLRTLLVDTKVTPDEELKIVIPSFAISEAAKIFREDNVIFSFGDTIFILQCGRTKIFSQVVAGNPPDYNLIQLLVDSVKETSVKVSCPEFSMICKQADIFARKDENQFLKITTDLTGITITGNAQQIGDSTGNINALVVGPSITMSVSSAYLREFLTAAKTSMIEMRMKDPRHPLVIYIEELPGYFHMLMPVAG